MYKNGSGYVILLLPDGGFYKQNKTKNCVLCGSLTFWKNNDIFVLMLVKNESHRTDTE